MEAAKLSADRSAPGSLLRLGSIASQRAKLGLDGKTRIYSYATKVEGLVDDLRRRKRRTSDIAEHLNEDLSQTEHQQRSAATMPVVTMPEVR